MTFGAVEIGGTKTLVAVGNDPDDLEPHRIETTDPDSTLGAVIQWLKESSIDSVGVSSFGPVITNHDSPQFGTIFNTPKPGWSGTKVHATLVDGLGVPVGLDTDVGGAALGEGRWGASAGLETHVYVTVGTGIGAGLVMAGRAHHGIGHPELGHVTVVPHPRDEFRGRCPFHGPCLEGMASGPALVDRFGPVREWPTPDAALDLAVYYLGQGLRNLVYAAAPQRIVVGGGVSHIEGFHSALRSQLVTQLSGYPGWEECGRDDYLVPPGLGDLSGLAGALILAEQARA